MSPPVLIRYTITDDDVRGPFVRKIPRDFEAMARLPGLGYWSATQLLAEQPHTSEEMMKLLNRGKTLDSAGQSSSFQTSPMVGRMVRSSRLRSTSRPRSFEHSGAMTN
jgi:hypothetical protein